MLAINIFAICKLVSWSNCNLVIFCQWYFFYFTYLRHNSLYRRRVNEEYRLPYGLTLGAVIADDCAMPVTALARTLQFLPVNKDDSCRPVCYHGNSSRSGRSHQNPRVHSISPLDFFNVVGVIGAESSPSSVFVANLLSMFAIPQVITFCRYQPSYGIDFKHDTQCRAVFLQQLSFLY